MFVNAPQTATVFGVAPLEAMIVVTVCLITSSLILGLDRKFMGLATCVGILGVLLTGAA